MSGLRGNQGPRYRHVTEDSAAYETISVDKLTPIIGAEITGVDLSQPLSNRTQDEIHRALAENSVIFLRNQHLTPSSIWRSAGCSANFTSTRPHRMKTASRR